MRKTIKLFADFLEYLEYSRTAVVEKIDNTIPMGYVHNALDLFVVWQSLQNSFPDLIITSGYRCLSLNKKVGGAPNSKHCICKALDFCSMHGREHTSKLFIPVYEFLRKYHPNVGYIYSDTKSTFIHFQLN